LKNVSSQSLYGTITNMIKVLMTKEVACKFSTEIHGDGEKPKFYQSPAYYAIEGKSIQFIESFC